MNDGTLIFDTKIDTSGFDEGLDKIQKNNKNTSNQIENETRNSNKNLINLKNTAKLAGGLIAGKLVKDSISMGMEFNNQIESFTGNFSVLLGSQEKAVKKVNELKVLAQKTPFGLADLSDATKTLLAFQVPAKKSTDILKMLGDISLGDKEKLKGLALVFGQVSSAGKLTGQDLMQFINQGFNPLNYIAKRTGESMGELRERMSKGGVTVKEVEQALKDATSQGGQFYQGMEVGAQTFEGKMSTLKDTFSEFMANKLKPFNEFMGNTLVPTLTYVLENFEKFQPILILIGIAIGTLTALYVAYNIQQALATAQLTLWGAVGTVATTITTALGTAFAFLTSPIGLVIIAIGSLIAIIYILNKNWDDVMNVMKKFDKWLTNIFMTDWSKNFGVFGDVLNSFFANAKNVWTSLKQVFKGIITFITGVFSGNWKKAWQGVKDIFKGIMSTLGSVIKAPLNAVIGLINGAISGINSISFTVPKWIPKWGGKHFGANINKIPYLENGGILKKGQIGFLEGNGAEAVVPLEKNKYWIGAMAKRFMEMLPHETINNSNQTVNFYNPIKSPDEVTRAMRIATMYKLEGV